MAAACDIVKGDVVEYGIVRVLTNCDGNENPYVFTWSDQVPNTTWATGSGASTYYNTGPEESANTHMCAPPHARPCMDTSEACLTRSQDARLCEQFVCHHRDERHQRGR
jgi:hypothetical protein